MRMIMFLTLFVCLNARADDDITQTPEYIEIHGNGIYTTAQHDDAYKKSETLRKKWEKAGLVEYAKDANLALRGIFTKVVVLNLHRNGFHDEANEVSRRWKKLDGQLVKYAQEYGHTRKITSFDPWNKELALLYWLIEAKLGYQLCYMLRITDLATFLWTPTVVFHPCQYGEVEFGYHFAHDLDGHYRALAPCVAYWLTTIGCSIATFGAGYFFICSPIAMLVEMAVDKGLAPWLAPKIYARVCGTKEEKWEEF